MNIPFSIIAAVDRKRGIGKSGTLPWRLPADLQFFHDLTEGAGNNVVIMGRTTWESLPKKSQPLSGRKNIVISSNLAYDVPKGVEKVGSFHEALLNATSFHPDEIFVIGGGKVYAEAIAHPSCSALYLTEIDAEFECDSFFPDVDESIYKKMISTTPHEQNGLTFCFTTYERVA